MRGPPICLRLDRPRTYGHGQGLPSSWMDSESPNLCCLTTLLQLWMVLRTGPPRRTATLVVKNSICVFRFCGHYVRCHMVLLLLGVRGCRGVEELTRPEQIPKRDKVLFICCSGNGTSGTGAVGWLEFCTSLKWCFLLCGPGGDWAEPMPNDVGLGCYRILATEPASWALGLWSVIHRQCHIGGRCRVNWRLQFASHHICWACAHNCYLHPVLCGEQPLCSGLIIFEVLILAICVGNTHFTLSIISWGVVWDQVHTTFGWAFLAAERHVRHLIGIGGGAYLFGIVGHYAALGRMDLFLGKSLGLENRCALPSSFRIRLEFYLWLFNIANSEWEKGVWPSRLQIRPRAWYCARFCRSFGGGSRDACHFCLCSLRPAAKSPPRSPNCCCWPGCPLPIYSHLNNSLIALEVVLPYIDPKQICVMTLVSIAPCTPR